MVFQKLFRKVIWADLAPPVGGIWSCVLGNCLLAISVFVILRYQCVQGPYCWCVTSGGDHSHGLDTHYLSRQLVYGILNGFNITGKSHLLNQNIQIPTTKANVYLISLKAKPFGELNGSWLIYYCYILIIYQINRYTLIITSS